MSQENSNYKNIIDSYKTFAIDASFKSNLAYRPEFLYNNPQTMKKVSSSLEKELNNCQEFIISVAFITKSGITPFLLTLKELEKKNIKGKILTTDYLNFSEPDALKKLSSLKNLEIRIYSTVNTSSGFHTKGYIFKQNELYHIIIGSSNWTANALSNNREWNTKLISTASGELYNEVLSEFNSLWNSENTKSYESFIDEYRERYTKAKIERQQRQIALDNQPIKLQNYNLKPNKMQVAFVNNLRAVYNEKINTSANKGLLISATGTGKSYASAFGMRDLDAQKILFLVHREQIAKQTKETYERVFGKTKTYGLISGNVKNFNNDCVFSTMQTISKPDVFNKFDPSYFDVIIIDECHHAGASSYKKLMEYFKPKFWLGMTASPGTNNYDIYEIFNHNIIYEISLQQALNEDLLCTFHYFGITDITFNGRDLSDKTDSSFLKLKASERVDHVLAKAEYYGYSGDRVKGLIFCRNIDDAQALSDEFNKKVKSNGNFYRTIVITGSNSQQEREDAIYKLTTDNDSVEQLDYILTVDVFNEGVDIPEINQVILLRPTQSIVVFIQQLGRGLRKCKDKEYVVIIDFIANYTNNYMIPMALYGDRSFNKDNMRRFVREGENLIPGCSSVHFDEISRKKIYESVDRAKTNSSLIICEAYDSLKNRLNRIPTINEFEEYGSIDVTKIFLHKSYLSYHEFLKKKEKSYPYKDSLSSEMEEIIIFISSNLLLFKRIQDLLLLKTLIVNLSIAKVSYASIFQNQKNSLDAEVSVYNNLTNKFPLKAVQAKFTNSIFIEKNDDDAYSLTAKFKSLLQDNKVFYNMVNELLDFGISQVQKNYNHLYKDTNLQLPIFVFKI